MITVFKRTEKKYMINGEQTRRLEELILDGYMVPDRGGAYMVQNLYFDNANWDIVTTSIRKPPYKEKMRMRCYGPLENASVVFLELKKKYQGIVYKRRVVIPKEKLEMPLIEVLRKDDSQIAREMVYHLQTTGVEEKMFLSYRRKAFSGVGENKELRITYDRDVMYRLNDLNFNRPSDGRKVLDDDAVLLEIKSPFSIPLWLSRFLSDNGIFSASFSKYGTCFGDYWQDNAHILGDLNLMPTLNREKGLLVAV